MRRGPQEQEGQTLSIIHPSIPYVFLHGCKDRLYAVLAQLGFTLQVAKLKKKKIINLSQ